MHVELSDFFRDTGMLFANQIMDLADRRSRQPGDMIFHEGHLATHFYILLSGRVRIAIGRSGQTVHIVSRGGEAFGWSSLIGRQTYTASAECLTETTYLSFSNIRFQKVLQNDPASGMVIYKRLSMTLANRLMQTYEMLHSASTTENTHEPGTGQFVRRVRRPVSDDSLIPGR